MDGSADFRQNRERVGIPFEEDLVRLHWRAVLNVDLGPVHNGITFALALLLVDDDQDTVTVHRNQFAFVVANRIDVVEPDESVALRILSRLLADTSRGATDVERTHRE